MKSTILIGDARKRLAELPAGSVRTCVTSPPYFGLRDYGTATWGGGSTDCDHLGKPMATKANINKNCGTGNDVKNATAREFYREICGKCGATRIDAQIGLEETPDAYVAEMVALFREVWRVLADDGTLWLNIGDSYFPHNGSRGNKTPAGDSLRGRDNEYQPSPKINAEGLKGKDLIGIPWRVAFALQADGWYLRSDIIWHKPNPMPESVTDRPTKSHEYLFLLSKSPRYYYDHEAVKEPVAGATVGRMKRGTSATHKNINGAPGQTKHGLSKPRDYDTDRPVAEKRNKRDVWTITTKPFKGAHFAVMPEALVEPCVLAGSAEGDTVLDPFTGSGTVAVVANRLGRNFVGTELNPEYVEIAQKRIINSAPLLNKVEVKL